MTPQPLYRPTAERGVHRLQYSWTGWPSAKTFTMIPLHLLAEIAPVWANDGLQLLESRWTPEHLHLLFATSPSVAPTFLAARAKGRLDYALRKAGLAIPFSRKVSVRSLGENTRRDVEAYIEHQVEREQFVDPRFEQALLELQIKNESIDLSQPGASAHGRYWYNLHLVLVTEGRWRIRELELLRLLRDSVLKIASKKQHLISRLSVMPDHLHAALRPWIEESPLDVVHAYANNLAHMAGRGRLWQDGYYVGTFGEYSIHSITERE
jgi:REP element-mobilizing transposase RayT